MLTAAEARFLETRDRILARRNPELLERERAEFEAMTDEELAKAARLVPSDFGYRQPPFSQRLRFLILPIGLMAVALLASIQLGGAPGHTVPISMLIAAAVFSRVYGGLRAARIAVALAAPISAYILTMQWGPHEIMWSAGVFFSLLGLCMPKFDWLAWRSVAERRWRASKLLGHSRRLG